ncbi:PepSY domain-containing protein [Candidatus Saccharibacteria bacterium]|nr:PepSY domain-containing protein [Candidatus Saccharibacteria bacterium]
MPHRQKGFAHITLVAAAVVLIAAAGVGYYVYNNDQSTNLHQENATEISPEAALPDSLANVKSVDEIRTIAADDLGSATIIGIELDDEDGTLVYKVKLSDGRVLMFNALSGMAMSETEDNEVENHEDIPAGFVAGISIDQARQTALAQRPGKTIIKIELEMEEGVAVYSVRFSDSGRVDVNATNGAVVRVEAGDEEDSSDDNGGSEDEDSSNDSSDDNSGSSSGSSN